MRSVAIIVFPGVQALDGPGPMDVFQESNAFIREGFYIVRLVGPPGMFTPSNGTLIVAQVNHADVSNTGLIAPSDDASGIGQIYEFVLEPEGEADGHRPWCARQNEQAQLRAFLPA